MNFKIILTDEESIVQGEYKVEVSENCPDEEEESEKIYIHPQDFQRTKAFNILSIDLGSQILLDIKALYHQQERRNKK